MSDTRRASEGLPGPRARRRGSSGGMFDRDLEPLRPREPRDDPRDGRRVAPPRRRASSGCPAARSSPTSRAAPATCATSCSPSGYRAVGLRLLARHAPQRPDRRAGRRRPTCCELPLADGERGRRDVRVRAAQRDRPRRALRRDRARGAAGRARRRSSRRASPTAALLRAGHAALLRRIVPADRRRALGRGCLPVPPALDGVPPRARPARRDARATRGSTTVERTPLGGGVGAAARRDPVRERRRARDRLARGRPGSVRRSTSSPGYRRGGFFLERSGLGVSRRAARSRPCRAEPGPERILRLSRLDRSRRSPDRWPRTPTRRPRWRWRRSRSTTGARGGAISRADHDPAGPRARRGRLDDHAGGARAPATPASASAGPAGRLPHDAFEEIQLRPEPEPDEYAAAVARATDRIRSGELRKVVLARTMLVEREPDARPQAAPVATARRRPGLLRVRDPQPQATRRTGSSSARRPSCSLRRRGRRVEATPLAGSSQRFGDVGSRPRLRRPAVPLREGSRGARRGRRGRRPRARRLLRRPRAPARARAARHRERVAPGDAVPGPAARPSVTRRSSSSPRSTHPGRLRVAARDRARDARASSSRSTAGRLRRARSDGWTRTATASGRSRCGARRSRARRPGCSPAPASSPTRCPRPSSTRPSASSGRCSTRSAGADGPPRRETTRQPPCGPRPSAAATAAWTSSWRRTFEAASTATSTTWTPPAARARSTAGVRSPARSTSRCPTPAASQTARRSRPCGVVKSSRSSGRSRCGRNEKMTPPSLFGTTNVTSWPRRPLQSSEPTSCSSVRSPQSATVGAPDAATPERGRHEPVDPARAAVGEHPQARPGAACTRRGRAPACSSRPRASRPTGCDAATSRATRPSYGSSHASIVASTAAAGALVGVEPGVEPGGVRRAAPAGRPPRARGRSAATAKRRSARRAGSATRSSGSTITQSAARRPRARARPATSARRRPAGRARARARRAKPSFGEQELAGPRVPGDPAGPTSAPRSSGHPSRPRELEPRWAPASRRAREDHAPRSTPATARASASTSAGSGAGRRAVETPPNAVVRSRGRPGRRRGRAARGRAGSGAPGREAGPCDDRVRRGSVPRVTRPVRVARDRARRRTSGRTRRTAPDLVDRLVRADPAELGRPVGGQERPAARGTSRPRRPPGRSFAAGGAARAGHRDRTPGRLREAEREEAGGPLVEVDVDADVSVPRERERERCRARPRRDARVLAGRTARGSSTTATRARERDVGLAHAASSRRSTARARAARRTPPAAAPVPTSTGTSSRPCGAPHPFERPDRDDDRAEREERPRREPGPGVRELDHDAERDRTERRDDAARGTAFASAGRRAGPRASACRPRRRWGCRAGCSRPGSRRRAGPSAPLAHQAALETVSALTNAVPAVAITPKNRNTITSPSPSSAYGLGPPL